jgi:uncharacterized protein YndB with AHSA1/START domain
MSDIVERVTFPESPEIVWLALTSRELLSEWLMPTSDYEPTVGVRFTLRAPKMPGWDGVIHGEVLEMIATTRLVWSWRGSNMRAATRVTFTLEPAGTGTALTLEHTGFAGLGGFILSRMHRGGWAGKFLRRQLPRVLARVAADASPKGYEQ